MGATKWWIDNGVDCLGISPTWCSYRVAPEGFESNMTVRLTDEPERTEQVLAQLEGRVVQLWCQAHEPANGPPVSLVANARVENGILRFTRCDQPERLMPAPPPRESAASGLEPIAEAMEAVG